MERIIQDLNTKVKGYERKAKPVIAWMDKPDKFYGRLNIEMVKEWNRFTVKLQ